MLNYVPLIRDKYFHINYRFSKAETPSTPTQVIQSPKETTSEIIQAQISALPEILKAQETFGPQFTQQQLESLQRFGPEFAQEALALSREFGPAIAEQTRLEQEILAPERVRASEAIAKFLEGGPDQLTPEEMRQFTQDVRAAQSVRGLAESGFGAQDEFSKLTALRQSLKNRFLDVALSTSGRLPAAGGTTVSAAPQAFGPGQVVQNLTPTELLQNAASQRAAQASIFGTQANIFGTQQGALTAQRGQTFDLIGDVVNAYGRIGGALISAGGCWVAAEIFGGWYHPKTVSSRIYVNFLAPKWFKRFYLRFGERIAKFIKDKPFLKKMIRPIFEKFARLGGYYGK